MSGSIPMHPTRGIDPHGCCCTQCGADVPGTTIGHALIATTYDGKSIYYTKGRRKVALRSAGATESDVIETRGLRDGEKVRLHLCGSCIDKPLPPLPKGD
jgi:hypothetical protein